MSNAKYVFTKWKQIKQLTQITKPKPSCILLNQTLHRTETGSNNMTLWPCEHAMHIYEYLTSVHDYSALNKQMCACKQTERDTVPRSLHYLNVCFGDEDLWCVGVAHQHANHLWLQPIEGYPFLSGLYQIDREHCLKTKRWNLFCCRFKINCGHSNGLSRLVEKGCIALGKAVKKHTNSL